MMSSSINRVLFDGWSLVNRPNRSAAIHLLTIMERFPEDSRAMLALPGETIHQLPAHLEIIQKALPAAGLSRLLWEQHHLEKISHRVGADLMHLTTFSPTLVGRIPVVISPAESLPVSKIKEEHFGRTGTIRTPMIDRIRQALASGGMERVAGVVLPGDVLENRDQPVFQLPPVVHPFFDPTSERGDSASAGAAIPLNVDGFILYHGDGTGDGLDLLFESWDTVNSVMGEGFQLLLIGLTDRSVVDATRIIESKGIGETVKVLPALALNEIARLYKTCQVVVAPGSTPVWGGALRLGIACGKPVVALETKIADEIAGPAAYLVPGGTFDQYCRAVSAALISILVEEQVSETLSESALLRSRSWHGDLFQEQLGKFYGDLLSS